SGRKYNRVEKYLMEDAEIAIVALGTTVESARQAAQIMRDEKGIKVGVVSPRVFRPFPRDLIIEALQDVKAVATMDRSSPGGTVGMLFNEISGAMINCDKRPIISNYIYGLGGRDMTIENLKEIITDTKANADAGKSVTPTQQFSGLRGPKLSFF
ncbi:MAG: transketolase C-terminal domain-containing protein, partial [Campylobacterota bacterium]